MTIDRVTALTNEILDRRHENEVALVGLLSQLVCEAFALGRSKLSRRKVSTASQRASAIEEYRAGTATLADIATRLNMSRPAVHRWVTKAGARRKAA
jgi:AraC-like DNA-binding protein